MFILKKDVQKNMNLEKGDTWKKAQALEKKNLMKKVQKIRKLENFKNNSFVEAIPRKEIAQFLFWMVFLLSYFIYFFFYIFLLKTVFF